MLRAVHANFMKKFTVCLGLLVIGAQPRAGSPLYAQEVIGLTLDSAVDIAMGRSYRIKQLELGIESTRYWLKSRQASLKSKVSMNLSAPEVKAISETKWNSTIEKDEIVHSNTRLWQMDLSLSQPVILFGYPTNGYLSLNSKMYKYLQKDGINEVDFYNRLFLKFQQPFLLPNNLKNNIEDAELDLERSELDYITDRVNLIDDIADDFYDLFDVQYKSDIYRRQIENLEKAVEVAQKIIAANPDRAIESAQVQVELANAREQVLKTHAEIRQESARIKQRLQLTPEDSVYLLPEVKITPITIDVEKAVEYGYAMRPVMRKLAIDRRKNEIELNNSTGWDAFHVNLEMTYGLERQDDRFAQIWEDYDGSYSVSLNAYVPIWDWGRSKARTEAYRVTVKKTELYIEERRSQIRSDIINAAANLEDYQQRALNMRKSLELVQEISDVGTKQYQEGAISLHDLLQMIARQKETELNFLQVYLGYRRSLLSLMIETYYDFENRVSLIDKFRSAS